MKTMKLLFLVGAITAASGCSVAVKVRDVPDPRSCMPEWYLQSPEDPDYLLVASTATSSDMQMSVDKALQAGRAELSSLFDNRIERMFKQLRNETGRSDLPNYRVQASDVSKSVVSGLLLGTRIRMQEICLEGSVYRAYVLVEMPLDGAADALVSHIRSRETNHTTPTSAAALEDLEAEIKAYEDWKRTGVDANQTTPDKSGSPSANPSNSPVRRRR